jgi:hypothetical protein
MQWDKSRILDRGPSTRLAAFHHRLGNPRISGTGHWFLTSPRAGWTPFDSSGIFSQSPAYFFWYDKYGDLVADILTCVLGEFKQNQFAAGDAKPPVIK